MATEVAANVNCDEEITALGRVQQARDDTMENADRPSEFNTTGKGTQPHDPSSGGGHGGVPGPIADGQGGVRINNSMDSHGPQSMNMSKDGNVTKTPNCNSTGPSDGVLPQAGRPNAGAYNGPSPNVDPFSSGALPQYMENSSGNKQATFGQDGYGGGYFGNRNNGGYGMNQHGGPGMAGNANSGAGAPNQGMVHTSTYNQFDGNMNSRPGYPNMPNRSGMGSPMGPGGASGYGGSHNPRAYVPGDRISSTAPTLSQLLQGQKHPSHNYSGNFSGQGDVNAGKGPDGSMGMMGQSGPYQSQWPNRGHMQHPMYPGQRQMGMMPDGQSPMQKRPYPGGPPGPYQNQYAGRQYQGMSPQMYPNPMYPGNRSYNAPGGGTSGGGGGTGGASGGQFPQQQQQQQQQNMVHSPHPQQTQPQQPSPHSGPQPSNQPSQPPHSQSGAGETQPTQPTPPVQQQQEQRQQQQQQHQTSQPQQNQQQPPSSQQQQQQPSQRNFPSSRSSSNQQAAPTQNSTSSSSSSSSSKSASQDGAMNRPPSLPDLSGSLDDLPTGCDFSQSTSAAGGTGAGATTATTTGSGSGNAITNTSSSSTNHSGGSGGSSTSTAPPLSPATSVHSVHSPHVHPSVTALRPSPSPVGSPASHISRSSLSPASVHGGSMTPQPSQSSSNTPDAPSHAPSQTPPSATPESRGNYGRQTGAQGYGSHHGNTPSSGPNNPGNMNYEQRMRNNSNGSSGGGGGGMNIKLENNSPHSGYNSSNMPNASHGMGANNQSGPNNMSPNVGRGGPGMSPTYGFGPNAQGQMHRTDSVGSGPSPGLSPGPSPGPGGVGVVAGAQAAAAAAVAAAANSAHLTKRNQYPLNQQMQGQQPPPPNPNQQGPYPQSLPQHQQWNQQQTYRQHQQYNQGNGPPFPGGAPPTNADQTNFNQMPSSVPNDAMHGYMHPSSGNQMPPHTAATTIANTNSGSNSTSVTQSITTPVASSVSSLTPSTASESSRDAATPGTPHSIIKEENVLSRPPSVHSRPSPLASPGAMSKSSQEDMANTPSPGKGMQQGQGPQQHQPPPPYPGMYHQQSLPHPHPQQHHMQQHPQQMQQHQQQHPGQQQPPHHPGQPPHPGQQMPQSQQPQTPQQHQGAPQPAAIPVSTAPATTASTTTTTTSTKSKKGQSQEPASKLTNLNLPKKLYKLYELCPHPERRVFLDRLFKLMEDRGQPIRTMPQISSHVLDLFKLYNCVKERGGVIKVSKSKQWKQIAIEIAVGNSNSAAFTLKKNYIRHLLAYECLFDRGGIDPQQILAEIDTTSTKKSKESSSASAAAAAAMNHHPNPSDPYNQFGPQGGKPGFPPMPNQMHGYGPPSMYGNNMGPMGPHMGGPRPNMPNSNVPGNMHPGGPGGDMTGNSVMVCDPFSDMEYQHGGQQQQQQQQGPYPGQNAMNGSFPPNSHAAMNHQFRNNMGGPPSGPGGNTGGANNIPFGGPPGPGESDPYSMPNRNMPCNDPYAMNSYTRRGSMDPYSGGGGGGGGSGGSGGGTGTMNQANAGQYPGGNHPPGAPNFDQNRYSASPTTHMSPSPGQGPPSAGSQPMMPPSSSSSTPDPQQQQAPFPSRFGSSSRPTTPSDSHTSASSSPFLPPPYSAAGPSPAKQQQAGPLQTPMSQASPSVPPSQPSQLQQQQQQQTLQKPPTPTPTPPKGQTPPQPSPQSGAPSQPAGPPAQTQPQPQQQAQPGGQPPSSQPPPQPPYGNDHMQRMQFPQKRPSDVFPPPPKRPDYMGQHGDGSHGGGPGFHGMPPYSSQQGNFSQGGYGISDRPMGPSSFPPVYNDRQQPPHPPHGPGAKRDGMPPEGHGKAQGPSPSWGSVQQRSGGNMMNQASPFSGARTLHSVLTQGMPPRGGSHHPHPISSMQGMKPHKAQQPVYASSQQKKEMIFPPDSVEATQPVVVKTKRKTSKEIGAVEAWKLMMSLKSGLLAESTWALEVLSVLLFDNNTVMYFDLKQMKGLLEIVCEHYRALLIEMFGCFQDLEIRTKSRLAQGIKPPDKVSKEEKDNGENNDKQECDKEKNDEDNTDKESNGGEEDNDYDSVSEKKSTKSMTEAELLEEAADCADVERLRGVDKLKPIKFDGVVSGFFCNQQVWDVYEGFDAGSIHWQEGGGEMTKHILSVFQRIESEEDTENSDVRQTTLEWLRHCSEELKAIRDLNVAEEEKHVIYVSESQKKKGEVVLEDEEQFVNDTPSLVTTSDVQNSFGQRCVCLSNIIRSLSFIPGNDIEMAKHPGLITMLSRILLLHHSHPRRKELPQTYDRDDQEDLDLECPITNSHRWWSDHLECMRENALVTITNLGGVLDMSKYVESVTLPMLDGLLHWAVCVSACALDPFPTVSSDSPLTPQRLAIEALAKLSIQENNVDMILATPPFHRLERLYATLTQYLGERSDPVMRELSLVLLSNIARSDMKASRAIATKNSIVSFLLRYIEDSEYTMSCEKNTPHMINHDLAKPSHDMMRRAGDALASLARVPANKALFLQHQNRLLNLSMSPLLDSEVKERIASALYELAL